MRANRSPFASTDTGHFKAVVTKPQNVLIMRDIACAGYVAGCNTRWFAKDEDGNFTSGYAAQAIQDRLSFADDNTDRYASMLAFPCYEGQFESGQLDTVMSVTSRLLPWEVNNAGVHNSFPGGPEAYLAYSGALQLGQVHYGEDMKAAENQDFISQGSTNNATCFLGPSRRYDPFTRSFMSLVPGQGHFGPDAIPGDARWRRGESVSLKAARDSMCRSPQAQTPAPALIPNPPTHQPPTLTTDRFKIWQGLARIGPARADGLLGALSSDPALAIATWLAPTTPPLLLPLDDPLFLALLCRQSTGKNIRGTYFRVCGRVCVCVFCSRFAVCGAVHRAIDWPRPKKSFWRRYKTTTSHSRPRGSGPD